MGQDKYEREKEKIALVWWTLVVLAIIDMRCDTEYSLVAFSLLLFYGVSLGVLAWVFSFFESKEE